MKNIINILEKHPLFFQIGAEEILRALTIMNAHTKDFNQNDYIVKQGEHINYFGMVIEGEVQVSRVDFFGKNNIITQIKKGDIFAETFLCAEEFLSPVAVIALNKSKILFLNYTLIYEKSLTGCSTCAKLNRNMLKILAKKNRTLRNKLDLFSLPTVRDKIMYFLSEEGEKNKSPYFQIDFNRNQLAEYLNVNRSALSRELSNMKKEGLLDYYKNNFKILEVNKYDK